VIFLDANVFLRHLTQATTSADLPRKQQAGILFRGVERGDMLATTSEVVMHEVCFVLGSPRQYGYSVTEIAPVLRDILQWPGFFLPTQERVMFLRAFDLWEQHPQIEFSDSVIAARCERSGYELATFDSHFERVPSITLWQPQPEPPIEPGNPASTG
jgi:predicted nucleic acid-binding protein